AVPPGSYRVTAIADQNGNRRLDPREAFDTATVRLDTSVSLVLWTFTHDTTPPRLHEVNPVDTTAARMTFSEPLDPAHQLDTAHVHLFTLPDTSPVALAGVWTGTVYDSLEAKARTTADSLRRLSDTTHQKKPDTTRVRQRAPLPAPPPNAPGAARQDTTKIR